MTTPDWEIEKNNTIPINSSKDLWEMNPTGHYELVCDINCSGVGWDPIDGFSGLLDGQGHTISGVHIHNDTQRNVGIFSQLEGTRYC